jgi:hypothetical protein
MAGNTLDESREDEPKGGPYRFLVKRRSFIGRKQRTDIGEEILVRELVEYAFFGLRGADKMGRPAQNASVLENELADSSIQ